MENKNQAPYLPPMKKKSNHEVTTESNSAKSRQKGVINNEFANFDEKSYENATLHNVAKDYENTIVTSDALIEGNKISQRQTEVHLPRFITNTQNEAKKIDNFLLFIESLGMIAFGVVMLILSDTYTIIRALIEGLTLTTVDTYIYLGIFIASSLAIIVVGIIYLIKSIVQAVKHKINYSQMLTKLIVASFMYLAFGLLTLLSLSRLVDLMSIMYPVILSGIAFIIFAYALTKKLLHVAKK